MSYSGCMNEENECITCGSKENVKTRTLKRFGNIGLDVCDDCNDRIINPDSSKSLSPEQARRIKDVLQSSEDLSLFE